MADGTEDGAATDAGATLTSTAWGFEKCVVRSEEVVHLLDVARLYILARRGCQLELSSRTFALHLRSKCAVLCIVASVLNDNFIS